MSLEDARRRAIEAFKRLEWQPVGDSPTTKYYTDWRLYEKALGSRAEPRRPTAAEGVLYGPCAEPVKGDGYELSVVDTAGELSSPEESRILAAHYMMLESTTLLHVSRDAFVRLDACTGGGGWLSNHLVIKVEPGVEASIVIVERRETPGSTVVELVAGEKSRVRLFTLLEPREGLALYHLWRTRLPEGAELYAGLLGSSTAMYRVEASTLLATGSRYRYRGLLVGTGSDRVDHIVDTIHAGPRSVSRPRVYGYALDKALVVVRGLVDVKETAVDADTVFEAEVVMLGPEARGYANPMMEIRLGRVEKASHRAAQYRVLEDQMFYLQSRGLDEKTATMLILLERSLQTAHETGIEAARELAAGVASRIISERSG